MRTYLISLTLLLFSGLALAQKNRPVSAPAPKNAPITVAILLYPGVELLDFAGPLEVFSNMNNSRVFTVAARRGPLNTMKKSLTLIPDYTLANCPKPDVLVVPGASGDPIRAVTADTAVINWIRRTAPQRQLTMSVCTGAYLLGKAGLLDNKTVTTHWASTQMLQQMTPKARVMEQTRFVEDGNLLTTAGVSAGIDGALHAVTRLRGASDARAVAEIIEYDHWNPESGLVIGQHPTAQHKPSKAAPKRTTPTPVAVAKPVKQAAKMTPLAAEGIDPVCRMTVPKGTKTTLMFGGKQYGFCSGSCKTRFERDPATYTAK